MAQIADWVDEFGRPILDAPAADPIGAKYAAALLALLPSGVVWPRDDDSTLAKLALALVQIVYRLSQRAAYLLEESPAGDSLIEMLPEWEATTGLPDECSGAQPTVALRQQTVRAKIAARGGQSIPYFVSVAAQLGVAITVQEFVQSKFGVPFGGQVFTSPDAAHTWKVTAPSSLLVPFTFGLGQFGDPFGTYGSTLLYCMLNRIKPAHTVLVIAYS